MLALCSDYRKVVRFRKEERKKGKEEGKERGREERRRK